MMPTILQEKDEKSFLELEKNASIKIFRHCLSAPVKSTSWYGNFEVLYITNFSVILTSRAEIQRHRQETGEVFLDTIHDSRKKQKQN